MRKMLCVALCTLLVSIYGCVPSLHPLYFEEDLVFEQALLGTWSEPDSSETWTFSRGGDDSYQFVFVDDEGKRGEFVAHLLALDGRMFLDLYPEAPEMESNDFYKGHLIPAHSFMMVRSIEPTLELAVLDHDWLKKRLQRDPELVEHELLDDVLVLTGRTRELQRLVLKLEGIEDAWNNTSLERRPQQ